MFYSHEVLTSRKYGVATVWLVATLGASSKLKKINRKAIREVDVPKACRTIIDPGAPMALRLQGNLLYGVSRVYTEQCSYVLSDAQNATTAMKLMLRVIKNAAIDPEAGRARPEQLIFQDDPSFLPEFVLPPPELLADLNIPVPQTRRSNDSQTLTPFNSQREYGTPEVPIGGLVIPSSTSGPHGEFHMEGDYGPGSIDDASGVISGAVGAEVLPEVFSFDADGNFIDIEAGEQTGGTPQAAQGAAMHTNAGASAQVRLEHEEGQRAAAENFADQMDVDLPILRDDLPEGDGLAPSPEQHRTSDNATDVEEGTISGVAAPMQRRKRRARVIPPDHTMELRNKDLIDWNANYLQNMAEASRLKKAHRAHSQAKKNAEYWVWGAGIGGIGPMLAGATGRTPIDMFYGDNLFQLYTGIDRKSLAGKKHYRDSGIDEATEAEARRVRPRNDKDEEQVGRGEEDEGMFMAEDEEVELPRDAPAALDDQQLFSAMPWNMSASLRGSSVVPRSGVPGSMEPSTGAQGSMRQRLNRLVSASPLQGRGRFSGLEALGGLDSDLDIEGFGLPEQFSSDGVFLEPEDIRSPPAGPRVREALSAESGNFLAFISDAVGQKQRRFREEQAEIDDEVDEVLFEELLPPEENTKMVACQGLMMVLALGTAGMVSVRQDVGEKEIGLSLTQKAREVLERLDVGAGAGEGEEDDDGDGAVAEGRVGPDDMPGASTDDDEEMEMGEEAHFQEQMVAGAGNDGEGDDDEQAEEHDSLYEA